nr:hypothetical protein [Candidatus Sigynarchaeota archaeon]
FFDQHDVALATLYTILKTTGIVVTMTEMFHVSGPTISYNDAWFSTVFTIIYLLSTILKIGLLSLIYKRKKEGM